MDKSAASSYVYAKASGMLAKSFIGKNVLKLFEVKSLSELWILVFNTEVPLVPEVLLAKQIEIAAQDKFIKEYTKLLSCYSKSDKILISLLSFYEYSNLKDIASSLAQNKKVMPQIVDLGKYSVINYSKWPNLEKMTENTQFDWCKTIPSVSEQKLFDLRMDKQYVREIWESANHVSLSERKDVVSFIQKSLLYRNIVWALRLIVYYNMKEEEVIPYLLGITDDVSLEDPIAGQVLSLLNIPINSWEDWNNSFLRDYINPNDPTQKWTIDPRWVQQKLNKKINDLALKQFHKSTTASNVLVSYFKIKQFELDCIRTAAESIRLNVESKDAKNFIGII